MNRIRTTIIGVIAIIIVLSMRSQATRGMGMPLFFNLATLLVITMIAYSVVRAWLLGY
ncbi:MAG: hypothetical protein PVJ38_02790 [Candidatus Bathyarchaeota archaeon]